MLIALRAKPNIKIEKVSKKGENIWLFKHRLSLITEK